MPHGEVRTQYAHVIDLLPTALEISGSPLPNEVRGIKQDPVQGTSLAYSLADASAPTRHAQQYYFLFGAGGIVNAKGNPEKLRELQALFAAEAQANHAYPLINWSDVTVKIQKQLGTGFSTPAIPQGPSRARGGGD